MSQSRKPLKTKVGVTARKAEAAARIGVNQDAIAAVRLDIETMRQHGILVDLDIHGLSLLRGRAAWSELGIPEGDVRRKYIRRGSKDLFPGYTNRFDSLASRFRQHLERHARDLEGFRPYRWLPYVQYGSFVEGWNKLQAEWDDLKNELLEQYDTLAAEAARALREMAHEAWDSLMARYKSQTGKKRLSVLLFGGQIFENVEVFATYVVAQCNKMPSRAALEHGLYVDYRTALLLIGSDLEAERVRLTRLQAQREAIEARAARARARHEAEQCKLQAMHEAELRRAQEQIARTISPIQEYMQQIMADVYRDVTEIIASISKNGYVRGNVAERARGLLALYQVWAIPGLAESRELEKALTALRALVAERPLEGASQKQKYDTAAVLGQLRTLSDMTHAAALDVERRASIPTRAGVLEL